MKKIPLIVYTAVITACISFSLSLLLFIGRSSLNQNADSRRLEEIRAYIDRYAVKDFSEEQAGYGAAFGYLYGLDDPYCYLWTAEEYEEYMSYKEGKVTGIGVSVSADDPISDGLFVDRVYGNSPAEAAGLKVGDLIVELNGRSVLGRSYQEISDEFDQSADAGVSVAVLRDGVKQTFFVEFKEFVQRYVDFRMIGDVAYIRIHGFWLPAVAEFRTALSELVKQSPKALIVDVRNNLGGDFDVVTSILDPLIPKGEECVVVKYKDHEEIVYSGEDPLLQVPISVLINEDSASASELLASCLRDVCGATLVGTRSHGKGVGQTLYSLSDGTVLKFTTFYYMTKSRVNYDTVGLSPDETVTLNEEQTRYFYALDESNDPQLQAALASVRSRIPS